MLIELQIRNFLIIESLDLSFDQGMTVITGETGAGKSILLDALQFVLGARADSKWVRDSASEAMVIAQCGEYLLKRVITKEGRSKGYINGELVSIQELKTLGESLLNWVGQNEHQALLKSEVQRDTLDVFAKLSLLQVRAAAGTVASLTEALQALEVKAAGQQEYLALKRYQFEMLDALKLEQEEWNLLQLEQKKLAGGHRVMEKLSRMLACLQEEDESLALHMKRLVRDASELAIDFHELHNSQLLLDEADLRLNEAYHELKSFYESLDLNPERLLVVEARLSEIHAVSRKLQMSESLLFSFHQSLQAELQAESGTDLASCRAELQAAKSIYQEAANIVTQERQRAALDLSAYVTAEMKTLGMEQGEFRVECKPIGGFSVYGQDEIQFCVRMNPGQKWGSLKEVASGGELSRLALLIAILNAKQGRVSTQIFDEVDVGVSGAVAEKVGALLAKLGQHIQVICITHLPQVAMLGDQHIYVHKEFKSGHTFGYARALNLEERIEEVAAMLSGKKITDHARALVREKLASPGGVEPPFLP